MDHPGFFERAGPFSLNHIAERSDAALQDETSGDLMINDIRPLNTAGPGELAFLDNPKYLPQLETTRASGCFVQKKFAGRVPQGTAVLLTPEPYRSYAKALALFYPDAGAPKIASGDETASAYIDPTARLEDDVIVEAGAVIGPEARIGAGTRIAAGAIVGYRCAIGRNCFIGPRAVLAHALIGNHVIIHAGVTIGQDGFGFAMGRQGHLKVNQIGRVIIQDWVEIGANSAVDRGALRDTVIGEGTKIDNLVQIGHNVTIGRHCVIVGQVGISGSVVLEDFVVMGGQSAVVGHVTIGAGAQIAGSSGVTESVPRGERWGGSPARSFRSWARELALMKRLSETLSGKHLKNLTKLGD